MRERCCHLPSDIPEAHALIERLCRLQGEVASQVFGYVEAADCICGRSGFWPYERPTDFRNSGVAVAYIERVVRDSVAARRGGHQ